jgi:Domain of unknown function (DUF4041)/Meiotically up-regulated gene 113
MTTLLLVLLVVVVGGSLALLVALVRERAAAQALAIHNEQMLRSAEQRRLAAEREAKSLQAEVTQLAEVQTKAIQLEQSLLSAEHRRSAAETEAKELLAEVNRLAPWSVVADANEKATGLIRSAEIVLNQAQVDARILTESAQAEFDKASSSAKDEARAMLTEAKAKAEQIKSDAEAALLAANRRAADIVAEANRKAESVAGKAMDAVHNAERYEAIATAMRNRIEGYGDRYLVPPTSLIDDLADDFSHKDAGRQLKHAREQSASIVRAGRAANCDYAETSRRNAAERFVLDAFNGKVESILSKARSDNFGTLNQELDDAFEMVNFNGSAFRDARITVEYLAARREELRWASTVQELKRLEQEEQRKIREQIREEEKARRDYERAIKETAKEEERIRAAMTKAESQIAVATEAQRTKYEAQLAELTTRLHAAEQRGQRALSMAEQTRRGHVYIISNTGSFGEHVYKIGLTRRLEPLDRIDELGDASVPFDFDVHAMILSDDAPGLETKLHKHFILNQVNKVNHRKEFFRVHGSELKKELDALGVEAHWTLIAEARQYRETLAIERAIESDPAARSAWVNRQLLLDPVDVRQLVSAGDERSENGSD